MAAGNDGPGTAEAKASDGADFSNRASYRIAVFEGDGIGPEVMAPTLQLLRSIAAEAKSYRLDFTSLPAGAGLYRDSGEALPGESVETARQADAILLSAMGLPGVRYPDGTEIAPQIDLRMIFGLYAGVRPVFIRPGQNSPLKCAEQEGADFVLIRESTEGLFASHKAGELIEDREARETLRITRGVSEKLFDFSFALAEERLASGRGKGLVTCVDKANVFQAFAFFRKIFEERAAGFPAIRAESGYVDAIAMKMVQDPGSFDVMVTENMFGDILSDLGAGLMGSLGLAPSADIGDAHAVFQPCHGTAPDIAGQGKANPLAMILSAGMMLDWLGQRHGEPEMRQQAERLRQATLASLDEARVRTADLGGTATTEAVAMAVEAAYAAQARG
ncbi:MAG: isocitrate/isopropylmalate family dehydrogenase [Kiloniellales bacterium]